jgi:hypothetical protein
VESMVICGLMMTVKGEAPVILHPALLCALACTQQVGMYAWMRCSGLLWTCDCFRYVSPDVVVRFSKPEDGVAFRCADARRISQVAAPGHTAEPCGLHARRAAP